MEWICVLGVCFVFIYTFDLNSAQDTLSKKSVPWTGPTYLISVPDGLLIGTPNSLAVTLLSNSPVRVTAEVKQADTSLVKAEETFTTGLTGILTIPPIPESSTSYSLPYTVVVKGYQRDKEVFTNTTTLNILCTTFIQTEKSTYQPGETVRLRILSVQPNGRPFKNSLDIVIRDPKGNVIQRWGHEDSHVGFVSKEFRLSDNPILGTWIIMAAMTERATETSFTVEDYKPPHFKVLLRTAPEILVGDDIIGDVTAQFFNGQPVQGTVSISITLLSDLDNSVNPFNLNITKEINGSTQFFFSKDELLPGSLGLPNDESITIYVTACVTAISTGITTNKTVPVNVIKDIYQLDFQNHPHVLKPYLHFYTQLRISRYDLKPLSLEGHMASVSIEVTQKTSRLRGRRQQQDDSSISPPTMMEIEGGFRRLILPVPEDGVVLIQLLLEDDVEMLGIQARFMFIEKTLEIYDSNISPSDSYLQIQPVNPIPAQIGEQLEINVESTFQLSEIHYLVMSRKQVVDAGTQASPSFSLSPTAAWSPEAWVTVYWILPDGEVINDVVYIPIAKAQLNNAPGDLVENLYEKIPIQYGLRAKDDPFSVFKASNLVVLTDANLNKIDKSMELQMERKEEVAEEVQEALIEALIEQEQWGDQNSSMRQDFRDFWLWEDATMSALALDNVHVTEDITSWVLSKNNVYGLASIPQRRILSQELQLSLEVPAHITRGEQLLLEVSISNYLDQDNEVMVLVEKSQQYDFVLEDQGDITMANARRVIIESQGEASMLFPIMPLELGEMEISVHAMSANSEDDIVHTVLVKPEGVEWSFSETLFLDIPPDKRNLSKTISFSFPPDVVPGSQRAHVAVVGDILGLSISGLGSLVEMPVGCGEQNMILFAPNVYILQYLDKSLKANEKIRSKALANMMSGYERELSYQRKDGSFSAFGNSDPAGSTWLTAYVLKSFLQARPFMQIDPVVLSRAMAWLVGRQATQGEFTEAGRVIHTEMLGGMEDGPVSLTAYVLMTLLEDQAYVNMFSGNVPLTVSYLEARVNSGVSSNYSLCLAAYALSLVNSPETDTALAELTRRADIKDEVMTWKSFGAAVPDSRQTRSSQIEMASYVLLALYKRGSVVEGLELMKWLSQQRTHLGGFGSTQDTVIALQALECYAAFSGANAIDISIRVSSPTSLSQNLFFINSTSYMLQQGQEIDADKDIVLDVFTKGRGFGLFQMNVFYNLESKDELQHASDQEGFSLTVTVFEDEKDLDHMNLSICTRLLESQIIPRTGMLMLDVGMLSGFTLAPDAVSVGDLVRKVEILPGRVSIYLDSLNTSEVCISLPLVRVFKVAHLQAAVVQVYDYYEPGRRAVRSYKSDIMHKIDACAFCGELCGRCRTVISVNSSTHSVNSATYTLGCLFAIIISVLLL
ncbi:CD109 antigen-like [Osmerus eperlanus]|uniref:CD109 antigen-like n=1 Tax=Osmerus eperlanus TaxID=29151 RepID=UPI002E0F4277